MVPCPLVGGSQESSTDTMSGVAISEVTSLGPAGKGGGRTSANARGGKWNMMLLTANDHGCHKVAEWSCACSRTPHCYLDTVLCECSQLSEAVGECSGLHLRAAACTGAIAYHIRKGVPILVSASWWTPPDHYGGSSDRNIDILGRTSRSWGHREREQLSSHDRH